MTRRLPLALVFAIGAAVIFLTPPNESRAIDYDCSDFPTQAAAQETFVNAGGPSSDPYRLDGDEDGVACESNPCPCSSGGPSTPAPGPPPDEPTAVPEPSPRGVVLDHVTDGDTLAVRLPDGTIASVRLIGIDTPEKYGGLECGAEEASTAMSQRVSPGRRLRLIRDRSQDNVDIYGRLLRYVELWKNGRDLGEAQIQSGWAKVYVFETPFKRLPSYRLDQHGAKKRGRGVWGRCSGQIHQPL